MANVKKTSTAKVEEEKKVDINEQLLKQMEALQKQIDKMQKELDKKEKKIKQVEDENKEVKRKARQLDRNRRVSVRSVVDGGLTYVSKATGLSTTWSDYGDEHWIEVEELIRMKSSSPAFFKNPYIVIDDEDVVEYLGLQDIYSRIIPVDELDDFFKKDVKEMEDILKKAPRGTKKLIASKSRELVEKGELDSNKVIKMLEEALTIDLSMVRD